MQATKCDCTYNGEMIYDAELKLDICPRCFGQSESAGERLARLAKDRAKQDNLDYLTAQRRVEKDNPKLARDYIDERRQIRPDSGRTQ